MDKLVQQTSERERERARTRKKRKNIMVTQE
jgi:hypothetical protein